MKSFNTMSFIMFFAVAAVCAVAAPQPHHKESPRRNVQPRNIHIWRAFSMLSVKEQQELMKLQRTAPEKFREVMQKKAAEIHAARQAHRQKIRQLAGEIRSCKDEKQKNLLRQQLRELVKSDFEQRLATLRRNIEANKKRIAAMEKELKKREQNSDAVIDAITDSIISGKTPPRPPRSR